MVLQKEPSLEFQKIINVVRLVSKPIGVNVVDPNYRINFQIITTIVFIILFLIFSTVTLIRMYEGDWTVGMEVFSTLGTCINGIAKVFSILKYCDLYAEIHAQLNGIYIEYEKLGANYGKVMGKLCERCRRIIKVVGIAYVVYTVTVIVVPIIILAYNGKRHVILHFLLPKLDLDSDFGYFTNLSFQATCVIIAGFGLYAGDLLVFIYLTHAILFTDIIKLKVQTLNDKIDMQLSKNSFIEQDLNDIIRWHQNYDQYLADCNKMFNSVISVTIFSAVWSCINTLYLILSREWPGAYTYLVLSFTQLYSYCLLGTQTEICNEELCKELYNIHFYALTKHQQHTVRLMLLRSQRPRTINIANILPLTVSTGLGFSRIIYSSFMMMLQFVN